MPRARWSPVPESPIWDPVTSGGPLHSTTTVVYYLYEEAFYRFNLGYASAVAYLLFAVTLILAWAQMRLIGQRKEVAT